jgi:hypothetical protein
MRPSTRYVQVELIEGETHWVCKPREPELRGYGIGIGNTRSDAINDLSTKLYHSLGRPCFLHEDEQSEETRAQIDAHVTQVQKRTERVVRWRLTPLLRYRWARRLLISRNLD